MTLSRFLPTSGRRAVERGLLLLGLGLLAAGCNYGFEGGGFPSNIRTIYIAPFENQTPQFDLQQKLYDQMLQEIPRQLGVRVVGEENADAIVRGEIRRYDDLAQNYRPGAGGQPTTDIISHEVQIGISIQIIDVARNVILWESSGLTGRGSYNPDTQQDQVGQLEAVKSLIEQIIDGAQSQW